MRVTLKSLKADVSALEAELKVVKHKLRHTVRELAASHIDLPHDNGRAGDADPLTDAIVEAALKATKRGEEEWDLDVTEPGQGGAHDVDRINVYIRSDEGLDWADANMKKDGANPYEKNGDFAWCGAFAAYCWSSLKLDIRKRTFPSTYRLWRDWQSRRIPTAAMRPGDVVVVWNTSATQPTRIASPMDTISSSVDSREPEPLAHGKATPRQPDPTGDTERESGHASETSTPSQLSTDLKPSTSHRTIQAVGGRKMAAYLVSVASTVLLAILDSASTEVLLSIQTALGLLVGGNAAEHRFSGRSQNG